MTIKDGRPQAVTNKVLASLFLTGMRSHNFPPLLGDRHFVAEPAAYRNGGAFPHTTALCRGHRPHGACSRGSRGPNCEGGTGNSLSLLNGVPAEQRVQHRVHGFANVLDEQGVPFGNGLLNDVQVAVGTTWGQVRTGAQRGHRRVPQRQPLEREGTRRQVAEGPGAPSLRGALGYLRSSPLGAHGSAAPLWRQPQMFSHLCLVPGARGTRKARGVALVTTCVEEMCPTRDEKCENDWPEALWPAGGQVGLEPG